MQRAQVPEGEDSLPLALDEQVELRRDVAQRVPLDGAPGHDRAEGEREGEREQGDERDRGEEPRAQRREIHGLTALYPDPRKVRIASGRPSLRRSCATWTSTVRVPPA